MVKKLLKFFAYALFFFGALGLFMPKSNLYYFVEKNLKTFNVVISDEVVTEKPFSLEVTNLNVRAQGVESAKVEQMNITLFLLYNRVSLEGIELSSLVENYLPSKIDSLELVYSLVNPFYLEGQGSGDFGEATFSFSLKTRELTLRLQPSKKMLSRYKSSMRLFKKSENGEYLYAKNF